MKENYVYADHAATTPVTKAALSAMLPYFTESYANPSAIYDLGLNAKKAVEDARRDIASAIGAKVNEIIFTSGGTESDNWVLYGAAEAKASKGKHIITTPVEHSAVFNTAQKMEKQGYEVTYLPVSQHGCVSPEQLEKAIRKDTVLVSIMMANNEIGTVLPIKDLSSVAREKNVLFHTDAVQAVGHIPVDVSELGVDFLSLSAHKFGGPKGVGALYMKVGRILPPYITGGGQEKGRRSGTSNVPGVVGMAAALREAVTNMDENIEKITALRDRLIEGVLTLEGAWLTGEQEYRLPGLASFVFEGYGSEPLVSALNDFGICASSGSACSAGSGDPSRILTACGYPEDVAKSSLRLTLNETNTTSEIDYIIEKIPAALAKLRSRPQIVSGTLL